MGCGARRMSSTSSLIVRWPRSPAVTPPPSPAVAAFTVSQPEARHQTRERLRDERRTLVAAVARRTGEAHRAIHARVNRATGAGSVTEASAEQLERGNRLLERKLG